MHSNVCSMQCDYKTMMSSFENIPTQPTQILYLGETGNTLACGLCPEQGSGPLLHLLSDEEHLH